MRLVIAGATGTVGTHVAREARERGHEALGLSRRDGHDLTTGRGLDDALVGADTVIDVTSIRTTAASASVRFFETVTGVLLDAGRRAGVGHHIALSIVGIDGVDAGYYAGKLAQEAAVNASGLPASILRAAQFHEFVEQVLPLGAFGPLRAVPRLLMRPVAAREVAAALVDIAESAPAGRIADLVGPADERLADLARRMLRHDGVRHPVLEISPPGAYWRASRSGVLRGRPDARRGAITFDEWLGSSDHTPAR